MPKKPHHSPYATQAFKPSAWLANIDFVKRLISTSHLLMVIMSEPMGGKSTFVDLLRLKLEPSIQTILLHAEEVSDEKTFIHVLSTLLNVEQVEREEASLATFFEKVEIAAKPVLVLIDDAELLSFDFLKQLAHLYKRQDALKRFYLCLVSDYSLTPCLHNLESEGLKHFIHTIEPGPLTEAEAKTYVLKYFQGKKGLEPLFQPGRFKSFYTNTQGQIAAINHQLSIFLEQQLQKRAKLGTMLKKLTVLPLILIGCLLGIGSGLHWLHHHPVAESKFVAVIPPSTMYLSQIPPWYANSKSELIEPPPLNKYADIALNSEDPDNRNQDLVLIDKVVVIPELSQPYLSSVPQVPVLASQKANEKYYTIQLMAAKNKSILEDMIRQYHLGNASVSIHHTKYSPWLVLTLGEYSKLTDATLALKNLSPSLKTLQPWIRKSDQLALDIS